MPEWTIIADDLTGACDTGAIFAARGYSTRVAVSPEADISGAWVQVINTETRELSIKKSSRVIARLARSLDFSSGYIYKKIDSTLRGHILDELVALLRASGLDRGLVCPAFPAQGRVMRHGRLLVNGVPIEDMHPAQREGLQNAIRGLPRLDLLDIRQGVDHIVEILHREQGTLFADAETEEDLARLAQGGLRAGLRLFCGSAGLAGALAASLPPARETRDFSPQPGPALIIAGSCQTATLAQVERLRQAGIIPICPPPEQLIIEMPDPDIIDQLAGPLGEGKNAALSTAGLPVKPRLRVAIAAGLGRLAAAVMQRGRPGALILTGGETASAVCRALGCDTLELGGQIQPGIAWGTLASGPQAGLPFVSKAGGFGQPDALVEAVRFTASPE